MMKVLIIDDEENVREAIKILGDWESLGVDETLEAADGRSGHTILLEQKPDIVLLDMRMPEMNGVEFLQAAERDAPDTVNIVVSGYDDFAFTQQAIRSRVFDYLLKPIGGAQLNDTLRRACEQVRQQRERKSELLDRSIKMNMSLRTLREKIFLSAIEGTFNGKINATYLRMIGAESESTCYGVAVLRILNQDEVCGREFGGDDDIFYFGVLNIADEICAGALTHFCCKSNLAARELVIVAQDAQGGAGLSELAAKTLTRLIRKLHELLGISAAAGVGTFQPGLSSLTASYRAAKAALSDLNLLCMKASVAESSGVPAASWNDSILSKMSLIRNALESGDLDYARGILDEYLRRVGQSGFFSLRDAARMLNEFMFLLGDIALGLDAPGGNPQDVESALRAGGVSFDYATFAQFRDLLHRITAFFFERLRQNSGLVPRFSTRDVKDYIDKNYFQEIKISMFTEKYYLSKAYVMKLFKQDYGLSIYEYVQKVRMEKASELLGDPKINIQNISQMVGYSNNNYFSKAFKNYYHISPSAYRTRQAEAQ